MLQIDADRTDSLSSSAVILLPVLFAFFRNLSHIQRLSGVLKEGFDFGQSGRFVRDFFDCF